MRLGSKLWLVQDEEKAFGKGPCLLLETVDKLGSLNKAAIKLNMSYSKAWSIIKRAESMLGFSLLERQTGGIDGGGSYLTPRAKVLIKTYRDFCQEANQILEELYEKYFKDI